MIELGDAIVDEVTERVVRRFMIEPPPSLRRIVLDIFDRIAAAIAAKNSGDDTALQEHVAAIDSHLQQIDSSESDEQTRISNIEAGLAKVADAVNPAPAPAGDSTDTSGAGTSGSDQSGGQPADPTA